jgi:glutamate formiminotransferase/formiminotetrahydrofolate cyclodeaminase
MPFSGMPVTLARTQGVIMSRIIECVPNFSEGRRKEIVDRICAEITAVPGTRLLDREMDASHNRAVVTFIGAPEACAAAAVAACAKAAELIDLNTHQGEHPRMGATDVIPFVPVRGVTMDDCVELARKVAREIGERLAIPAFLYEYAARDPSRKDLSKIRGKGFEEVREIVGTRPEKTPDFGPKKLHPTAGATAVGARDFLIAYNIYLNSNNLGIAKEIAKAIRQSSGGYAFCKAAGFEIADRGCVQVSMNLTSAAKTPVYRVFETVKREAARHGVAVTSSEVVGLAPLFAISDTAEWYLQIENWKQSQIIETALLEAPLEGDGGETMKAFLAALSSRAPTPGGGSASAYAGALAAALVGMVGRLNNKKDGSPGPLAATIEPADGLRDRLDALVAEDAASFNAVMAAWKLPESDPNKSAVKARAQVGATQTPLETMKQALAALKLAVEALGKSKKQCLSDAGVAALPAIEGARLNVMINLPDIADEKTRADLNADAERIRAESEKLYAEARKLMESNS